MEQKRISALENFSLSIWLKELWKNSIFIILAALIAVMGVRIYEALFYQQQYTTSETIAVIAKENINGSMYASLPTASGMALAYEEAIQSDIMKEDVEARSGEIPEGTSITAEVIKNTNLLVLSVTADNPQTAYRIMLAVIQNYHDILERMFSNAVMEQVQSPKVPLTASNPFDRSGNTKRAVLLTVTFMLLLVYVDLTLRDTVKTVLAGKKMLESECLGVISHGIKNRTLKAKLRRTNKSIVISNQAIGYGFAEEIYKLASKVEYSMAQTGGKALLISSVAENEGKSTIAANLALALARNGKKVLLMDGDFAKPSLYKIFRQEAKKQMSLLKYLHISEAQEIEKLLQFDESTGLYMLFNSMAITSAQQLMQKEKMGKLLEQCKENMDYVILDSSPMSVNADAESLIKYVDCTMLVIRQDHVYIPDINDSLELMQKSDAQLLGYVFNDFDQYSHAHSYEYGRYEKSTAGQYE